MRRKEAAQALALWGLDSKKIGRVRAVFKVSTREGVFCLKRVDVDENRLCFVSSVLAYLHNRGVEVPYYVPSRNGMITEVFNGERIILSPWMPGRELSYTSKREMSAAARTLGHFHKVMKDYQPEAGIKVKDKHEKWPEKLRSRMEEIKKYRELAKMGNTEFDRVFLQHVDWILHHMEEAYRAICNYYESVHDQRKLVQVCHGDPSKRNFLMGKDGQMYIVDFESMKVDLPISDLWRLLRRTLSRSWDLEFLRKMIDAYTAERPLSREELELLGIFLTFPEKIRSTLHGYYESKDHKYERLLKKLKVMLSQTREYDRVLAEFRRIYLQS